MFGVFSARITNVVLLVIRTRMGFMPLLLVLDLDIE